MTRVRILLFTIVLAALAGCGSAGPVTPDRYYSLVLASGAAVATSNEDATGLLIVESIQLPDYLHGRSIAMQTGPNLIESARHHFWAESLQDAIAKLLTQDIARHTHSIDVDRDAGRRTDDEFCRLRVEFDAFHPTNQSQVVASGRYRISSELSSERREFSLKRTLTSDGYAHAVDELRSTLEMLAQQISDDVQAIPECVGEEAADIDGD